MSEAKKEKLHPFKERSNRFRTFNTKPSKTDQSQAKDTDINVIVRRHSISGMVPGAPKPPTYDDVTEIPDNLRDIINMARSVNRLMRDLPPQLQGMTRAELLALTPERLKEILTPPAPKPDEKKEEPK